MLATFAILTAMTLATGQSGALRLTNDRATYGLLGATRPESKLLPGDRYTVTFDIENLKVSDSGKIRYSMAMKLSNSQGKPQFSEEPQEKEAYNSLGGTRMPAFAFVNVGTDTAPGEYTLELTVTDLDGKKAETLKRKFEVLPRSFGLVRLQLTSLKASAVEVPPMAVAGQAVIVNCAVVSFERDKASKQPNLAMEIKVLDEAGKPTLPKPFTHEIGKDVPENLDNLAFQLPLELNRAGKFTVELQATDRVSKKSSKLSFPLVVTDMK